MVGKNLIANLFSNVWGVISIFIFVPFYIKFLGIEAYGLVGFYATLIGFLSLADLGFSATLKREFARMSARPSSDQEIRETLRTYEVLYVLISLFISIIIWFSAPLIAEHWLNAKAISPNEITLALRLMGVSIALQLPSGLFIGGLMGLQRQVLANSLNIGIGILRGFGAVLVLWLITPSIFAFFAWQLISNVAYLLIVRSNLWRIISIDKTNRKVTFSWQVIRSTGRFSLGMASISLIGVLLSQSDKLIVSKFVSLEMFSYYSIASSLASLPIIVVGALGTAVFPRFVELVTLSNHGQMEKIYKTSSEIAGIILIPAGLVLIFFCGEFIFAWTGSNLIADQAKVTAVLLLGGQILQSTSVVPYNLAIAHGSFRFSQKIGVYAVLLIIPLLIFLTTRYGIVGAGMSWFLLNIFTFPLNLYFLHKQKLSNNKMLKDSIRGVILPLIITIPILIVYKYFLPFTSSKIEIIGEMIFIWGITSILSLLLFPNTLFIVLRELKKMYKQVFKSKNLIDKY